MGDSGVLGQGSHLNLLLDPIVRFDADGGVGGAMHSREIGFLPVDRCTRRQKGMKSTRVRDVEMIWMA